MKKIKKTAASILAVAAVATGATGISASAYNTSEPWLTYHTYSTAPAYTGQSSSVSIVYSTNGSTCYKNRDEVTIDDANGYVLITCTNGTMTPKKMYRTTSSTTCNPTQTGMIYCTSYTLYAYSTTPGSTYTAGGNMVTNS